MEVDVVDDPRTGHATEVPAEVEPFGLVDRAQGGQGRDGEPMNLGSLGGGQLSEGRHVANRRHEEVPRVRELVRDREREVAAMDEQRLGLG